MATPAKLILHHQTKVQCYLPVFMWPGREADNEHMHNQNLKSACLSFCQSQKLEIVSSSGFSCNQLKALKEHTGSFSRYVVPKAIKGILPALSPIRNNDITNK